MTLTDPQARRERIADLRAPLFGRQPDTQAIELADALEHIDNVEKDRAELNRHLEFAWETNRTQAARIEALEKEQIEQTIECNGLHDSWSQQMDQKNARIAALEKERDDLKDDYLRRHKDAVDRMERIMALEKQLSTERSLVTEMEENADKAADRIEALEKALRAIEYEGNWGEDGCWCADSYPDEIARIALEKP